MGSICLGAGEPIDELDRDKLSFDPSRNLYEFDDSGPTVSGLEAQSTGEPEQFFASDPLGLGIGCIEKSCEGNCSCSSSEGSPDEKRERAEALKAAAGPFSQRGPALELKGFKFGATGPDLPVPLGFPRPAVPA